MSYGYGLLTPLRLYLCLRSIQIKLNKIQFTYCPRLVVNSEQAPHPDFGGGGERDVARGVGVLPLLLRGLSTHQGGEGAGEVAAQ